MKLIRSSLRKAKAQLLRFEEAQPPVLIFGTRRGGTTMVADAVSANRGVWFADEPHAMFPDRPGYDVRLARLFSPKHSHYFDLSDEEMERFASFTQDLLQARFPTIGTSRNALPGLKANRSSAKILNAAWLLPWFLRETEAHIIAMVRHPGAQASSVMRLGWGYPVEAYMERPAMLEQAFSPAQMAGAREIVASGDPWRMAVLDWVVTSHPLRVTDHPRVHRVTYEDIVRRPEEFVDDILIAKCGLAERDVMLKAILRPSGSSHMNTANATQSIIERDVERILTGWRAHCSPEQLAAGQEILDLFGVMEYQF